MMYTQNDIFVFYEIINDIKPEKVLDVGMFLKSVGSVSRKIMDKKIDENIWMKGVDFMPEVQFPVFQQIYDEIITIQSFLKQSDNKEKYDLGVFLKNRKADIEGEKEKKILGKMSELCHFILINECEIDKWCKKKIESVITVKVEDDEYYISVLKR